ncbi:ribosomal protein S7 domain-containing protein [Kalaharituber pfeilii]|nr:ribosomal protein S7 domain-containing protein [Kalaharituber pfeilii]
MMRFQQGDYMPAHFQYSSYDSSYSPPHPQSEQPFPQTTESSPSAPTDQAAAFTTAFTSQALIEKHNYPKIFHPTVTPYKLDPNNPVSKYPLPTLPLPSTHHLHHRYSPLLDQVVNLFMRDGKKALAQKNVQRVLDILRTKPPPKEQTKYNLIASAPPLHTLPSNPLAYLQTAIDSVAPLMRLRTVKASGGFTNQVPEPLSERQRRRTAINWMMTVANGKKDRMRFAERFAEEVVAVVEGRSSVWERRLQIHKTAVGARANVKVKI